MTIYTSIGVAGAGLYLLAYTLLQLGVLRGSGYVYTLMNLGAASLVAVSLLDAFNLSSMIIQTSWIVISVIGLTRRLVLDRTYRFNRLEKDLHELALPGLTRRDVRRLLNLGTWDLIDAGTVLTEQGVPVPNLIYAVDGTAEVNIDGHVIATIAPGDFIGEITCLQGSPATATVTATTSFHCLRIPAEALRSFAKRNGEIQEQLERSFAVDLRKKLRASASRVASLNSTANAA